jgi:hypothetical protein
MSYQLEIGHRRLLAKCKQPMPLRSGPRTRIHALTCFVHLCRRSFLKRSPVHSVISQPLHTFLIEDLVFERPVCSTPVLIKRDHAHYAPRRASDGCCQR